MRPAAAALIGAAIIVAGMTAGATASVPLPAGVLAARPAVAEVPVDHLARLVAPADAYSSPGGTLVATLEPGPVIRTGETVRDETGRWHEIVTRHGLVWVDARGLAHPVSVSPAIR